MRSRSKGAVIDSQAPHNASFSATLRVRERRLAGRLEGFGDIVFGFAVSQSALQLPVVHGHVDLGHPAALIFYFLTFGLLASLWLIYHRMLSGAFKPTGIDLLLSFAYLALISLVPYAMYEITHNNDATSGRSALSYYLALYAVMTVFATVLTLRNVRRGFFYMDAEERDYAWLTLLRQAVLCAMMSVALGVDLLTGPVAAGIFLCFIPIVVRLIRKSFPHSPSAARLRVKPTR